MIKFRFEDLDIWKMSINIATEDTKNRLLEELDHLCRKITNFQKSLK